MENSLGVDNDSGERCYYVSNRETCRASLPDTYGLLCTLYDLFTLVSQVYI